MKYQTVLFDLDGTLLNTLDDLTDSTNAALRQCGYPARTREEVRLFVGNGVRRLMERAVPPGTGQADMLRCLERFKTHYSAHMEDKTAPYPGVCDLLEKLRRRGCRLGIISNKFDAAVKGLNSRWFSQWVEVAVGESETVRPKPSPDAVLAAMAQLDAQPSATLYVGDSDVDVHTAHNAQLPCAGVLWGFRDAHVLQQAGVDYIIKNTDELLDIIIK